MKASFNWLKELVDIDLRPSELAERLTMAGLEVESIKDIGGEVKGIKVSRILSVKRHPNADRLSVCHLEDGENRYEVVCGAGNVKVGKKVALAIPGAVLPGGVHIKKTTIRGIASQGMICSETELGLTDYSSGIMILDDDAAIGADITALYPIRDHIFNLAITPNRPDCLGILGLAREISSITGSKLRALPSPPKVETGSDITEKIRIRIDIPEICRRYRARLIEGVRIGPSPFWLRRRLELHDIRAINNVVDVTNYVMLEYGQPLHAFDYEMLKGGNLIVRFAHEGESFTTLDGGKKILDSDVPVIADDKGPVALAGIMGGARAEISGDSRSVLLECAFFDPRSIRRAVKKVGISTESSYRFERGVDINGISAAIDRASILIRDTGGGRIIPGSVDLYHVRYLAPEIKFDLKGVNALLGTNLKDDEIEGVLRRLGMELRGTRKRGVKIVSPPSYRLDLKSRVDLIEEVARITSYDAIPAVLPKGKMSPVRKGRMEEVNDCIRWVLVNHGFYEVINYSFISKEIFDIAGEGDEVRLLNPISEEHSLLRNYLFPSLLERLKYNIHRENRDLRLFEIGRVFISSDSKIKEEMHVSGLIYGSRYGHRWNQPSGGVDFYDIKGILENLLYSVSIPGISFARAYKFDFLHPGKSAKLSFRDDDLGFVGEIHPTICEALEIKESVYIFELPLDLLVKHAKKFNLYTAVPRYPAVRRDISLVIGRDIEYNDILLFIKGVDREIIEDVELFDVYSGKGIPENKISMGIRITYRSAKRTLKDKEVNNLHNRIVKVLINQFNVVVRGDR